MFFEINMLKNKIRIIFSGGKDFLGAEDFTGVFNLQLGRKNIEIALLRSPNGTIIELLKIKK